MQLQLFREQISLPQLSANAKIKKKLSSIRKYNGFGVRLSLIYPCIVASAIVLFALFVHFSLCHWFTFATDVFNDNDTITQLLNNGRSWRKKNGKFKWTKCCFSRISMYLLTMTAAHYFVAFVCSIRHFISKAHNWMHRFIAEHPHSTAIHLSSKLSYSRRYLLPIAEWTVEAKIIRILKIFNSFLLVRENLILIFGCVLKRVPVVTRKKSVSSGVPKFIYSFHQIPKRVFFLLNNQIYINFQLNTLRTTST